MVEYETRVMGSEKGLAMDRETWRRQIHRLVTPARLEKGWDKDPVYVCLREC